MSAEPVPSGPWVLREDLEPALFGECHPCYFQEQEDWRDAVVATLDALTHGRSDEPEAEILPCVRRHPRTDKPLCELLIDMAIAGFGPDAVLPMSEKCCEGCNGDGTRTHGRSEDEGEPT